MLVAARLIHRSKWSPRWLGHTVRATRSTLISMPWMHYQGTAVTRTDVERGASSMPYWARYAFPKHAYARCICLSSGMWTYYSHANPPDLEPLWGCHCASTI